MGDTIKNPKAYKKVVKRNAEISAFRTLKSRLAYQERQEELLLVMARRLKAKVTQVQLYAVACDRAEEIWDDLTLGQRNNVLAALKALQLRFEDRLYGASEDKHDAVHQQRRRGFILLADGKNASGRKVAPPASRQLRTYISSIRRGSVKS